MKICHSPDSQTTRSIGYATALVVALAVALSESAHAGPSTIVVPPAPAPGLVADADLKPFLVGHAVGTQNYVCSRAGAGVKYVLFTPEATLFDDDGKPVGIPGGGYLVLTRPWPSMLRGIYGDPDRFVQAYWSRWNDGTYFTGDGARRDEDGFYWLLGRVDDVLNVSGHRLGTMEVESALVDHPKVAEAAVVGKPHEIKGQAVAAFVTVKEGVTTSPQLVEELKEHVTRKIGAIARPDEILFAAELPKTRSGKIMRRLLRDIADGLALGDTTTLADPTVVAKLKEQYAEE